MEKSIILLNKELYEWKEHYESEKIFFAGEELDKNAIRSFAECVENIADLQQAIDILEKTKASCLLPKLSERDWKEDFIHENGNYVNYCIKCKKGFFGHKRRVICKLCFGNGIKRNVSRRKNYWIVSAQLPFHLIKGIFKTEANANKFNKTLARVKRATLVYLCDDSVIRTQFGWRNYMEKWLK